MQYHMNVNSPGDEDSRKQNLDLVLLFISGGDCFADMQ